MKTEITIRQIDDARSILHANRILELREAYDQGWLECLDWAGRDDLKADIDSRAYLQARELALAKILLNKATITEK